MKLAFLGAAVGALMALSTPVSAEEIVVGTNGKPGNPRVTAAEMFGHILEQKSRGALTVKVAHSADEHVPLEEVAECAEVLAQWLTDRLA